MGNLEKIQEKLNEKLKANSSLLQVINQDWLTQEICDNCMEASKYFNFEYIPNRFKTKTMCENAFRHEQSNINHIPVEFITNDMVQKMLEMVVIFKMHEYSDHDFDRNFLEQAFKKGSALNEKLSTKEKAMLLYCYPEMRSSCKEIDVLKKAWDIQVNMMTLGFQDAFKTNGYLPDEEFVKTIFFSDDLQDTFERSKEIDGITIMRKEFLKQVNDEMQKEMNIYINGGEKALEEYYAKIADEANYVYTNRGKLLADDLVELILDGKKVQVLDTKDYECTFYSEHDGYDEFAVVTLGDENYIVYLYDDRALIAEKLKVDVNELGYEIDYKEDAIYDVVSMAELAKDDFIITHYEEHYYTDDGTVDIDFTYKGKEYNYHHVSGMGGSEEYITEKEIEESLDTDDILCMDRDKKYQIFRFLDEFDDWSKKIQQDINKGR